MALSAELEESLSDFPLVVGKKMFGQPAFFVNGNMFAGVFGDQVFIRLSEADRDEFLKGFDEASLFEPVSGRSIKEYVSVPESLFHEDALFRGFLNKSYSYASSLPVKKKKA